MKKQKDKKIKTSNGYTLLEMVVYIAILSVFSIVVVFSLVNITKSFLEIRVERNINNAAVASIDRMVREIRLSNSVDILNSTFDANPGRITLNTIASNGSSTTVEFFVSNGVLRMKEGGVDSGALTQSNINVDNLLFNLMTNGTTQAIKISESLSDTRVGTTSTKSFNNTGLIRGSY
jgi:type II secretory pathway pseudopilin PulG